MLERYFVRKFVDPTLHASIDSVSVAKTFTGFSPVGAHFAIFATIHAARL